MVLTQRLEAFFSSWKTGKRLVVLTAYDATQAAIVEAGGVDLILVGDSLGMAVQGLDSTTAVTLEQMAYHTRMVARGRKALPIVADLPLGSYDDPESAVESSRILISAGADAVKFEGNPPGIARAILASGIPVMGHLGLLPQTAGSFRVFGKTSPEAAALQTDARSLADLGCFSIVLECVPLSLAQRVTQELELPTIGIGAGPFTNGQVLVFHDLLGLLSGHKAKFLPRSYPSVGDLARDVVLHFANDVRSGVYPSDQESYH
ncbi:MAG: 3-methyl-2-oxobutanoate hydroxymethyltransferase [Spirochaetales bacterium]|nr:3-methyl-2-oxobutanoate hydroxymethyltransferase [Spirochaetales bacterium]